ncbi:MAG TPA: hypothetical protein VF719_02695, partial [Abditibacteriaceae bacterium]
IERLLKVTGEYDAREYHSAYDDCLWRITTSGKADLEEFVLNSWHYSTETHFPIPLLVLMCRLYVLESRKRTPEVELAISFVSCHCSAGPGGEEEGATGGFTHLPD